MTRKYFELIYIQIILILCKFEYFKLSINSQNMNKNEYIYFMIINRIIFTYLQVSMLIVYDR